MNHGAVAVIVLAISAIILIILGRIYKAQIETMSSKAFSWVESWLDSIAQGNQTTILPDLKANVAGLL